MPLYRDFSDADAKILVWKYDPAEVLDPDILLEAENRDKIIGYHPTKVIEMLMVRQALRSLLPDHKILYNEREPYLSPPRLHVSITHSFPYAAIAVSEQKVGIDLEAFNEKIKRIRHKFLHEEEADFIEAVHETAYLTVIWCVKESLYKIHHSNYWSLKKHYEVKPFSLDFLYGIKCRVHDERVSDLYEARVEVFDNYCLSVVI